MWVSRGRASGDRNDIAPGIGAGRSGRNWDSHAHDEDDENTTRASGGGHGGEANGGELPAAAVLVAWMMIPAPPANADGQCTAKTNAQAHQVCMAMANGQCGGIGAFGASHTTCTYPDGSRDECDWHMTSLTSTTGSCTWFATPPAFPIGPPPPPQ